MTSAPLFGIIALAITSAFAQAPPDPKFGYEVVSVRKSDPEARGSRIQPGPQGGMRTTNTSMMSLLTFAFDVRDYQILEAPSWSKAMDSISASRRTGRRSCPRQERPGRKRWK